MDIIFIDTIGISKEFNVTPAIKEIPEWYKKTESYNGGKFAVVNGHPNHTIKKCMPVFDALTSGYIIKTYVDVYVSEVNGFPYFQWPHFSPIEFHALNQAENHPHANGVDYPKWRNPWSIKTPNGYSCLFTNPMHRENKIFSIFPGIVDTDKYTSPVNFPFVLNNKKWEGIIPAGTPLAQVIPFKRDKFSMKMLGSDHYEDQEKTIMLEIMSRWKNSYKNKFWNKKEYS